MKSRYSKLAILSLLAGLAGFLLALAPAPFPKLISVPLGFMAALMAGLASWSIRRAAGLRRGRRLAGLGATFGVLAAMLGILGILAFIRKEFHRAQRQQQAWNQPAPTVEIPAPAPALAAKPAANFTSNLPIVVLQAFGQSISRHAETLVRARCFDTGNGRASLDAPPDYDGLGTINLRGNTSLHLPKRSFTFHMVNSQTNQIKVPLLGLPKEEDWVLYAPYEDKTLMRDVLAFELVRKMGRYAPRTRFIELFLTSSDGPVSMSHYAGIYVLVEKIKRGKDRVDIAKLEPEHLSEPEITGGYILKRDHGDRDGRRFNTAHGGPYFYVYPKAEDITAEQRSWLTRYFNAFEEALYGENLQDPRTGYAAYLDVASFIDMHWLIEATKNVDGFRYSAFLTKDRGGKLRPEPPWDWNRSFGNANYYGGDETHGWYSSNLRPTEISWYHRLREDPAFAQRCAARWVYLRKDIFDPKKVQARIDEIAALLDEAQERNFKRWPVLGQHVTCNHYVGDSYEDEVRWMKKWIERRIAWIDSQVAGARSL
ncbi:MAG: hypothetical protein FJ398_02070 [Verrucomicrobia bacterium]|nr:hypothetical protein [Verrucomicrobiota bacterium]